MTDHGGKALFSAGALAAALSALYALGVFELHGDAIGEPLTLGGVARLTDDFADGMARWEPSSGRWEVEGSGASSILRQAATSEAIALALFRGVSYGDVEVAVRFRLVSGEADRAAGLVCRAKDARNYYLVRANGLESNLRFYVVANGERTILASVRVAPPAVDSWHTIKFVAKGERFQASLDGRLVLEHSDERFAVGSVGLWTKADSVTEFDDFEVLGSMVKGEAR